LCIKVLGRPGERCSTYRRAAVSRHRRAILTVSVALGLSVIPAAIPERAAAACAAQSLGARESPRFFPPRVSGDREFAGNGPVIIVSAKLVRTTEVAPGFSRDHLSVIMRMDAQETRPDWTRAAGTQATFTLYSALAGCFIDTSRLPGSFDATVTWIEVRAARDSCRQAIRPGQEI
jgi:hypothetical protein